MSNPALIPLSTETPLRLEDLPAWMRPARRRIDWGLLLVFLIILPVLGPLVTRPGLPSGTEAEVQVARGIQIASLLRSGILYSRWAPDFYNGLGSPIFNYIAPLPHYLVGFHVFMTDAQPVDSVKDFLCISILLAGLGMYAFVTGRISRWVGFFAAAGYVYSTPIMLTLSRQNSDLAVLLSLALLPCCLWAMDEAARRTDRRWYLVGVVLVVLWGLCELRFTLLGLPILVISALTSPSRARIMTVLVWLLPLTAFFWLPAFAEQNDVIWVPITLRRLSFYAITFQALFEMITPLLMALIIGSAGWLISRLHLRLIRLSLAGITFFLILFSLVSTLGLDRQESFDHGMSEAEMGVYGSMRDGLLLPISAYHEGMSPTDLIFQRTEVANNPQRSALAPLGVSLIERQPLASRYTANLGTQQTTVFDRYYFSGWSVVADGIGLASVPNTQGLLTAEIPHEAREVYIWFGTTIARIAGWLITFAGVILCYLWLRRLSSPVTSGAVLRENPLNRRD